jgi:toxin HigB-1
MIASFKCRETEKIFQLEVSKRFPREIQSVALRRLKILGQARALNDLAAIPGNRFEPLKGDRAGQCSIRVNDQFRVCFSWKKGHAHEVEIVDYH